MSRRLRNRRQAGEVYLNAIERAITASRKLPAGDVIGIKATMDTALREFGQAITPVEHWATMADAMNVAEGLADESICSDEASREKIQAAQQVLADVAIRHQQRGTWSLRHAEREALSLGLWLHGVQLDHCSFREYERAVNTTINRIQQARAGNASPGAIVIHGQLGITDFPPGHPGAASGANP